MTWANETGANDYLDISQGISNEATEMEKGVLIEMWNSQGQILICARIEHPCIMARLHLLDIVLILKRDFKVT
jgi:hypothetical protein